MPKKTFKKTPATRPAVPRLRRSHSPTRSSIEASRRIALLAAQAGIDKKAEAIEIIDVEGKIDYADFIVLMTGQSDRHVAAVAEGVREHLALNGTRCEAIEGLPAGQWVLVDFVDVVVHVFHEETRGLYNLDGLWSDARRVQIPAEYRTNPVAASTKR